MVEIYCPPENRHWFPSYSKAIIKFITGWRWYDFVDTDCKKVKFYGKLIVMDDSSNQRIFILESGRLVHVGTMVFKIDNDLIVKYTVKNIFDNQEDLIKYNFSHSFQLVVDLIFKIEDNIRIIE